MTTHIDERCRACGGRVLPVLWGMPDVEAMKAADRGELILGGCMLEDVAFRCDCGATTYDFDGRPPAVHVDDARATSTRSAGSSRRRCRNGRTSTPSATGGPTSTTTSSTSSTHPCDGVVKPWPADSPTPRYHHTYLAIDGWDYWTMGEPVDDTEVINRARLDETWS